jgi:hypothetical protein
MRRLPDAHELPYIALVGVRPPSRWSRAAVMLKSGGFGRLAPMWSVDAYVGWHAEAEAEAALRLRAPMRIGILATARWERSAPR